MEYNPNSFEPKWQKYWEEKKIYKTSNNSDKPKFYVLDMFPYPSGAGLHVGHPLGYIASDIYTRYKRFKGFNVLHPMGWDSFGLPSEEYAIQSGIHPSISTKQNIKNYKSQMQSLALSFDWDREINTSDPNYYKWTQWIFTELFNHYYDMDADKSLPIASLKEKFAEGGSKAVNANHTYEGSFDAAEWNIMSRVERQNVLSEYRLAYRKVGYVNWCEALGTVLANDQVKDGISERGGHPVEQRAMTQWYLRITAYAERLINDLNELTWSDSLKTIQKNWIGRSEGASIKFAVDGIDADVEVFTTRPDTVFGATYMVLAPKHELVEELTSSDQKEAVEAYLAYVNSKTELERMAEKNVTGVHLGSYAINPFNDEKVPIWIAEYVLKDYGTGAIMAVPSDDDRDFAFATKFELPIIEVIDKSNYPGATKSDKLGTMINSGFLDGMEVPDAIHKMIDEIEVRDLGKGQVNYKLRDANFSRQRYWGEPFPLIYDKDGIVEALPLEALPLALPTTDDFKPGSKSPLARLENWVNEVDGFTRETDVMPAVAGSSWYYLRYMDANNPDEFASQEAVNYWQDVDLYVGGSEHAVAHLLYSRFWHKFLFDKGLVPTNEPFKKLINQGMIQGVIEFIYLQKEKVEGKSKFYCAVMAAQMTEVDFVKIPVHIDFVKEYGSDNSFLNQASIRQFLQWRPEYEGAIFVCSKGTYQDGKFTPIKDASDTHLVTISEVGKMSKSKFNVINPDDIIERYGTDCFRMYEMFLGPIEQSKPWDTNGIDGVYKFLRKYWSLFYNDQEQWLVKEGEASKENLKSLHTCIKKVNIDIERFSFNTCVSAFMVCVNELKKKKCHNVEILKPLTIMLAPFAPYITEEIWTKLNPSKTELSIHHLNYPNHNESYLVEDSVSYPICINGKKRALAEFPTDASKEDMEKAALELDAIQSWIDGKTIRKVIVVPKKMINIVV